MAEFTIIDAEEQPYLYAERRSRMGEAEMGEKMGSAFMEVWSFMQANAIAPTGGALAVYHEYGPGEVTWRAGFLIGRDDMAKAAGTVKADVTPAGRTVHGTHLGSYAGLRDTYGEMHGFVQAEGVQFTAPTWEVYVNDPNEVAEDALITECYQALA